MNFYDHRWDSCFEYIFFCAINTIWQMFTTIISDNSSMIMKSVNPNPTLMLTPS